MLKNKWALMMDFYKLKSYSNFFRNFNKGEISK